MHENSKMNKKYIIFVIKMCYSPKILPNSDQIVHAQIRSFGYKIHNNHRQLVL